MTLTRPTHPPEDSKAYSKKKIEELVDEIQSVCPEFDPERCRQAMEKGVGQLEKHISSIRLGKAHPDMLENLNVTIAGSPVPLSTVASVGLMDSSTLSVTVNEPEVGGGIKAESLGLGCRVRLKGWSV